MAKRTLFIRNIEDTAVDRIKRAAGARQLTMAEYIERLVDLHDVVRAWADGSTDDNGNFAAAHNAVLYSTLTTLGLQTITG